jgi:hypothetical protein
VEVIRRGKRYPKHRIIAVSLRADLDGRRQLINDKVDVLNRRRDRITQRLSIPAKGPQSLVAPIDCAFNRRIENEFLHAA